MASPNSHTKSTFPPEIWLLILTFHDDLTHLWSVCRNVSQPFRSDVDLIFARHHIKNTSICFNLRGTWVRNPDNELIRKPNITLILELVRFEGENKTVAVFKDTRIGGDYPHYIEKWRKCMRRSRQYRHRPHYSIAVGLDVNDTELPGCQIDFPSGELRVDWKEMYGAFFLEEMYFRTQMARLLDNHKARVKELSEKVTSGELSVMKSLMLVLKSLGTDPYDIWKERRRKRFTTFFFTPDFDLSPYGEESELKKLEAAKLAIESLEDGADEGRTLEGGSGDESGNKEKKDMEIRVVLGKMRKSSMLMIGGVKYGCSDYIYDAGSGISCQWVWAAG